MSFATGNRYSSLRSDSPIYVLATLFVLLSVALSFFAGDMQLFVILLGTSATAAIVLMLRPKLILFLLVIVWLAYPTAVRLLGLDTVTIARLWPEALLLLAVTGQMMAWMVGGQPLRLRLRAGDILVALVFAGGVYAALLAPSFEALLYGFRLTYEPMLFYFLVRLLSFHVGELKKWLLIFIVASLIEGAIGFFFELTGPGRWYSMLIPVESLPAIARSGYWRMSSTLLNPLYFGPAMAMAGVFCWAWFLSYRSVRAGQSWGALLLWSFFLLCVWYSITRGAYILLGVGMGTVLISMSLRSYPMLILSTSAFLVLLVGMMSVGLRGAEFTLFQDSGGEVLASRFPEYTRSLDAFLQAPLGYGLGLGHASRKFDAATLAPVVYDSWYFKVLLEGGILGALLFLTFVVCSPLYLIAKLQHSSARFAWTWHTCVLGITLGAAVMAVVANVWEHYMVSSVLWMLFGFSTSLNGDDSMTPVISNISNPQHNPHMRVQANSSLDKSK